MVYPLELLPPLSRELSREEGDDRELLEEPDDGELPPPRDFWSFFFFFFCPWRSFLRLSFFPFLEYFLRPQLLLRRPFFVLSLGEGGGLPEPLPFFLSRLQSIFFFEERPRALEKLAPEEGTPAESAPCSSSSPYPPSSPSCPSSPSPPPARPAVHRTAAPASSPRHR